MNSLFFALSLITTAGVVGIAFTLYLIGRQRRQFMTILRHQAERQELQSRQLQRALQALEETQGKQSANLNQLALSHLSFKQDLHTLESKLAQQGDSFIDLNRRGSHQLH